MMIISNWKGFEIDSSEGYYGFYSNITGAEEGWMYLNKILMSPLLWDKAAFSLGGKSEELSEEIYSYLADLDCQEKIEKTEKNYEYCPYKYATSLLDIQVILDRFKEKLESIRINLCIRPLKSLEGDEYARLKTWYLGQFKDQKEGKARWRDYKTLEEKDFTLGGNPDYTDSFMKHYAFEASLQFYAHTEKGLSIYMCAGDPSFIIYLISTIFPGYELEFYGDHYISIDRRPDKIQEILD